MSEKDKYEGLTPEEKQETQEIEAEMEADNPTPDENPEEKQEEKSESEDKAEETEKEKPEEEAPEEEAPEEESEESEEEEETKEKVEDKTETESKRTPRTVPYKKYKEEKKTRQSLEKDLEDLKSQAEDKKSTSEDITNLTSKIAEETGIDQSVFDDFAKAIIGKTKIPDEVLEVLNKNKQENAWAEEDRLFNESFEKLEKDFPDEDLDRKKIKDLAFTEGHENDSLYEIYFRHIKPHRSPKKKSAESAKPGTTKGETKKSYKDMTDAEMAQLSDEEFDKASEARGKEGSRLIFE